MVHTPKIVVVGSAVVKTASVGDPCICYLYIGRNQNTVSINNIAWVKVGPCFWLFICNFWQERAHPHFIFEPTLGSLHFFLLIDMTTAKAFELYWQIFLLIACQAIDILHSHISIKGTFYILCISVHVWKLLVLKIHYTTNVFPIESAGNPRVAKCSL